MASSSVTQRSRMAADGGDKTRIMIAVSQSSIYGYPHASISSREAFDWTLNKIVRSNVSGFKILLLHVEAPGGYDFVDMDRKYTSPEDFKNMTHRDMIRGLHLLEYFVKRCHEIGVACEAWVKKGNPSETIIHEGDHVEPDFLVVGCRGLGPYVKVLVGSVSEFCMKHFRLPVIAIPRRIVPIPGQPAHD